MAGINHAILHVNLSDRSHRKEVLPESFYRRYLGGRGFIVYYLLSGVPAGTDPLGPENVMVFAPSVLTGSLMPGTSRFSVGALSPLTHRYGEGEAGGPWGPELKSAGYDAIVVSGVSSSPLYLLVRDNEVEFHDAAQIWGSDTRQTQEYIRRQHGDERIQVTCIGPAGEKMVRFACVVSNARHVAGRCGLGAVMGSKKLKAIAVRGTSRLTFHDREGLKVLKTDFAKQYGDNADNRMLHLYGTSQYFANINIAGLAPTRNFQLGVLDGFENVAHLPYHSEYDVRSDSCPGCPIACKQMVASKEGSPHSIDPTFGGPEFETMSAFSSISGNSDLHAMMKSSELANRYGLDSISTGNVIAFAIECYERGFLTRDHTGGLELKWGDPGLMVRLVEMIAFRQGLGDWLAEGVRRLSERLGPQTAQFAMHVKGQEFPMHDPRGKYGVGLGYAVSPTGADHLQSEHDGAFDPVLSGYSHQKDEPSIFLKEIMPMGILDPVPSMSLGPEKVRLFAYLQYYWSFFNMLDLCIFTFAPVRSYTIEQLEDLVRVGTGWNTSFWELMKAGERGVTLTRVFNLKHGLTRDEDGLPERMFQGIENGPLKGSAIPREDLERAISLYYEMMGWDQCSGVPSQGKLAELDIEWAACHLPRSEQHGNPSREGGGHGSL